MNFEEAVILTFLKGGMYFTIKCLAPMENIPIIAWIDG